MKLEKLGKANKELSDIEAKAEVLESSGEFLKEGSKRMSDGLQKQDLMKLKLPKCVLKLHGEKQLRAKNRWQQFSSKKENYTTAARKAHLKRK